MSRPATDAEAGRGLVRDDPEPAPEELRHRPERIEPDDGPPFDRCPHCERAGSVGSINPFAECPGRERPSDVEERAERAQADDGQTALPT
jgi:hypothetical protein